jgi:hypothetical protein
MRQCPGYHFKLALGIENKKIPASSSSDAEKRAALLFEETVVLARVPDHVGAQTRPKPGDIVGCRVKMRIDRRVEEERWTAAAPRIRPIALPDLSPIGWYVASTPISAK